MATVRIFYILEAAHGVALTQIRACTPNPLSQAASTTSSLSNSDIRQSPSAQLAEQHSLEPFLVARAVQPDIARVERLAHVGNHVERADFLGDRTIACICRREEVQKQLVRLKTREYSASG